MITLTLLKENLWNGETFFQLSLKKSLYRIQSWNERMELKHQWIDRQVRACRCTWWLCCCAKATRMWWWRWCAATCSRPSRACTRTPSTRRSTRYWPRKSQLNFESISRETRFSQLILFFLFTPKPRVRNGKGESWANISVEKPNHSITFNLFLISGVLQNVRLYFRLFLAYSTIGRCVNTLIVALPISFCGENQKCSSSFLFNPKRNRNRSVTRADVKRLLSRCWNCTAATWRTRCTMCCSWCAWRAIDPPSATEISSKSQPFSVPDPQTFTQFYLVQVKGF